MQYDCGHVAGQGKQEADGLFGGGAHVAVGRVDHGDAALRGGGNVYIVYADAGAAHDPQVAARVEQVGGDGGAAAGHEGVIGAHGVQQRLAGQAEANVNGKVLFEQGDPGGIEGFGHENVHGIIPPFRQQKTGSP